MISRTLRVLCIATPIASLAAGWFVWSDARLMSADDIQNAPVLPHVAADPLGVVRVEVRTGEYRLVLAKRGEGWVADDRDGYPARTEVVIALVSGAASMRLLELKTQDAANHSALGLSDAPAGASALLRFGWANGVESVLVGRRSAAMAYDPVGASFVRRPDDPQVWLARGSAAPPPELPGWFDEIPNAPATAVRRVTIFENRSRVFDAVKRDGFYRAAPDWTSAPDFVNDALVKRVAAAIVSGTFEDVRAAAEISRAQPRREVVFETDDRRIVVRLLTTESNDWISLSVQSGAANDAPGPNEGRDRWAYRAPRHRIEALATPVVDLMRPPTPPGATSGNLPEGVRIPGIGPRGAE